MYLIENQLHFIFNKINPGLLLHKIPRVKKWMKDKHGIENTKEWLDDFWTNKEDGYSLIFVGGWLVGIIFIFLISSVILLGKVFNLNIELNNYHFWLTGGVSYLICFFSVFKKDKYIKYFDEFEKWTLLKKRTLILLSLGFILFVIALFFTSLIYFN